MIQEAKRTASKIILASDNPATGGRFLDPQKIIDGLEIKPGMTVADFGCGTGYFSFPLAKKIDNGGTVYAIDILKEKLEAVESQAKVLGLSNLVVRRANLEKNGGSKLENGSLDWVFLVNMLFQNSKKELVLEEAVRVLKKGGKVLVIEWSGNKDFAPESGLLVSKDDVLRLAQGAGLEFLEEIPVSNFHYGIILQK